jgi:hypothetical protein
MNLPGETEAGTAGTQPCRGIARWAHRADAQQRGSQSSRAVRYKEKPSDDRPPCLENPRPEGAECTLTENAASPFHAEPKHIRQPHRHRHLDVKRPNRQLASSLLIFAIMSWERPSRPLFVESAFRRPACGIRMSSSLSSHEGKSGPCSGHQRLRSGVLGKGHGA